MAAFSVLVAVGFGLLVACQGQPASQTPATQAPAPIKAAAAPAPAQAPSAQAQPTQAPSAVQETLKVGISTALSGPAATGNSTRYWIQLGIDEVNAKGIRVGGKTYRLEPVVVDDKMSADGAREAANRLVLAEKVRYILGTAGSATAGAQAVTEPNNTLLISTTASPQSLGTSSPFTFQIYPHSFSRVGAMYNWLAKERPNVKRVAITLTDDEAGRSNADNSERFAKERGLTVVGKEFYPTDMKDAAPLVTRVLRSNPDVVDADAGARIPLWRTIMQALSEQGFKGQVIAATADPPGMKEGLKYLEGYVTTGLIDDKASVVSSPVQDLIARYLAKFGSTNFQASGFILYAEPVVLAQAMEQAGTVDDTEKIAKVLQEGQFDFVWSKDLGKSRFVGAKTLGRPAVLQTPLYLSKQENNKPVTFGVQLADLP